MGVCTTFMIFIWNLILLTPFNGKLQTLVIVLAYYLSSSSWFRFVPGNIDGGENLTKEKLNCLNSHKMRMNREELKMRKIDVTLQWLCSNGFVEISLLQGFKCKGFVFSHSSAFATKQPSFLTTGYSGNYQSIVKTFQANKIAALALRNFS